MRDVPINSAGLETIPAAQQRARQMFWQAMALECPELPAALYSSWQFFADKRDMDIRNVDIRPGRLPEWLKTVDAIARDFAQKHHLADGWVATEITNSLVSMINFGEVSQFASSGIVVTVDPPPSEEDVASLNATLATLMRIHGVPARGPIPLEIANAALEIQRKSTQQRIEKVQGIGLAGQWNPLTESRTNAKNRLLDEFAAQLDADFDRIERETAGDHVIRTTNFASLQPFRWLVRSQVLRQTYDSIARGEGKSEDAVEKAVRKAASSCGLTLDRSGRPRSQENKPYRSVKAPRKSP